MASFRFIISGKVQGVYYRKNIQENASREKFSGYVRNLKDGNVEACVTCDDIRVNDFIKILEKGSAYSKVTSIIRYSMEELFIGDYKIVK
jgi:acylphosphatase